MAAIQSAVLGDGGDTRGAAALEVIMLKQIGRQPGVLFADEIEFLSPHYFGVYLRNNIPRHLVPFRPYCDSQGISRYAGLKWIRAGKIKAQKIDGWWFVNTLFPPPEVHKGRKRKKELFWPPLKQAK